MKEKLDAMDSFFDSRPKLAWTLTVAFIAAVAVLMRVLKDDRVMLLLCVPGFYFMGRNGGMKLIVKFLVTILLIAFVLGWSIDRWVPCDGFGAGFRLFYKMQC